MTDIAGQAPSPVDPHYYGQGNTWEQSIYRHQQKSAAVWRGTAMVFALCLLIALAALVMLIPLQRIETVVLDVDHATGFVQVMRPLSEEGKSLSQNEAVTMSNVVQYIRARETYDPKALRDNYEKAALFSTGKAVTGLSETFSSSNPDNPMKLYGPDQNIAVTIQSVSPLNEYTYAVRFMTVRTDQKGEPVETAHWAASVKYRYSKAPMQMDWRFDNPLGFQVYEYRRDQESVTTSANGGASQ